MFRRSHLLPAAVGIITAVVLSGCSGRQPTPLTSPSGAAPSACDGNDLSASGEFGAGAGNDGFLITLTNHSTSSCILSGYLNLVDTEAAGPALHVSHESSMLYTDPGPHTIVVVSGASAYFGIGYAEAGGCAYGGAGFHAINIEFASDVLTLPIGAWRASSTAGVEFDLRRRRRRDGGQPFVSPGLRT